MRAIGMLTVLVLAGATFIFTANPHLRKDQKDVVVFIVIVAIIAVVGITAALISWRRGKVRRALGPARWTADGVQRAS